MPKKCPKCRILKGLSEFHRCYSRYDGLNGWCKACKSLRAAYNHKKAPWKSLRKEIYRRCHDFKNISYSDYGGRGIKCLITEAEVKVLYVRDGAAKMKKPSIDRINNDGNYEFGNCRFVELKVNIQKAHNIPILQFNKSGNFIKSWESMTQVESLLHIKRQNICSHIKNPIKRPSAGGFIWRIQ